MTAIALSIPNPREESNLVMPKLSEVASLGALTLVDVAGRAATAAEQLIDVVAGATRVVLPAATRSIGAFLPIPEVLNRAIEMGVRVGANVGCTIGALGAKCALQAATFGAPAWSQSARRGLAVAVATRDILREQSRGELLARCIAETCDKPLIKEDLRLYVKLRTETNSTSEERTGITQSIASLEKRLSGYEEFQEIHSVLKDDATFVTENAKRVDELALRIAELLLNRTESFYRVRVGTLAGSVVGHWEGRGSPEERSAVRESTRNALARRLLTILRHDLNTTQIRDEILGIKNNLHSVFGTYQALTKAAFGVVGGIAYANREATETSGSEGLPFPYFLEDMAQRVRDGFEGIETKVSEAIGFTGGTRSFMTNTIHAVDATGHVTEMESCVSGLASTPRWGVDEDSQEAIEYMRAHGDTWNNALSQQGQELLTETLPAHPDLRAATEAIFEDSTIRSLND